MNINSRISKIIEEEGLSVLAFERSLGTRSTIDKAIKNNTDLSISWITKIIEKYPKYSIEWLLKGKGQMLNEYNNDDFIIIEAKEEGKNYHKTEASTQIDQQIALAVKKELAAYFSEIDKKLNQTLEIVSQNHLRLDDIMDEVEDIAVKKPEKSS